MTIQGKFEIAFDALKKEAARVEAKDATLDEAITSFEKGMEQYHICVKILDEAEQRIQMVIGGNAVAMNEEKSNG